MGNNQSLQILRAVDGVSDNLKNIKLLPGQPFYNQQKRYLTIGHKGSNPSTLNSIPITVPTLEGYFDDVNNDDQSISININQGQNYKYSISPEKYVNNDINRNILHLQSDYIKINGKTIIPQSLYFNYNLNDKDNEYSSKIEYDTTNEILSINANAVKGDATITNGNMLIEAGSKITIKNSDAAKIVLSDKKLDGTLSSINFNLSNINLNLNNINIKTIPNSDNYQFTISNTELNYLGDKVNLENLWEFNKQSGLKFNSDISTVCNFEGASDQVTLNTTNANFNIIGISDKISDDNPYVYNFLCKKDGETETLADITVNDINASNIALTDDGTLQIGSSGNQTIIDTKNGIITAKDIKTDAGKVYLTENMHLEYDSGLQALKFVF